MKVKKWSKFTIGKRIALGFVFVLLLISATNLYTYFTVNDGVNKLNTITSSVEPTKEVLNKFQLLLYKTKLYTNYWIANPQDNLPTKLKLRTLVGEESGDLRRDIETLQRELKDPIIDSLAEYGIAFERVTIAIQDQIIANLDEFEDYNDIIKTDEASFFRTQAFQEIDNLDTKVEYLIWKTNEDSAEMKSSMLDSFSKLGLLIIYLTVAVLLIAGVVSYLSTINITRKIDLLKVAIDKLGTGEIPRKVNIKSQDEIGEMGESVNDLIDGLHNYAVFAQEIGAGNFSAEFDKLGQEDIIGESLLDMRVSLLNIANQDKKRTWDSNGQSKISSVLRNESENLDQLSYAVIRSIVEYMNINQGGIYIAEETSDEVNLRMTGCYAYDREKLVNKNIMPGEGIVGQCFLEGKPIHVSEIPENYIKIGSGLGEAVPTALIAAPLLYDEENYGVIELASFNNFEDHEVEFATKIGEIIAASIASVRNTEMTRKLLTESKELTNSLQAQEEELRQNQEEMMATQEEAERQYQEALKRADLSEELANEQLAKIGKLQDELAKVNDLYERLKNKK